MIGSKSGWSVLDLLTLDPVTSQIPIIVTTLNLESVRSAQEWLGDHRILILPKPFNPTDLELAVNSALGMPNAGGPPLHWIRSYQWDT